MRTLIAAFVVLLALPAAAQSQARPRPPGTLPLEEVPPPPALPAVTESEAPLESQVVTAREEAGESIQEYRVSGRLYMMRVTPRHGRPYVLIDHKGDGTFTRQETPLDGGVRVPQWVLFEF